MSTALPAAVAGAAPVLVAGVFVVSGRVKVASRTARSRAAGSALGTLVGKDRAATVYGGVGVAEVAIAALLLAGGLATWWPALAVPARVAAGAAAVAAAGFLGYLGYARIAAPGSSCGCVSARSAPVTWRSFVRAGALLAVALVAVAAPVSWPTALASHPYPVVAALALGGLAMLLLSPEAEHAWLLPLRRLHARVRPHPLAGLAYDLPLASTLRQLEASESYRGVGARLRSDVLEHWDEGEWRIVCYHAEGDQTAVFAVPRLRYDPDAVRLALVDDPLVATA
ncbi:hypothetical protein Athai_36270 [Actinocatenispora thailandica]|uniref:Methylamine utilisation protein MauE domain-containing protein n=1 Tax=Actinocatenispora thailandica TaxID=227318 RepID=A0A7R7HYD8_9ACTN|nr:MauE/DoxX family redox-associated membrane protein [Actinocatenispora thailandica]BCJ36124.1 hypothetical protein Athai_36270 [Actinocatenispora thailandica]